MSHQSPSPLCKDPALRVADLQPCRALEEKIAQMQAPWRVLSEDGDHQGRAALAIGASSADIRLLASVQVLDGIHFTPRDWHMESRHDVTPA